MRQVKKDINIGIFAAEEVGYQTVEYFVKKKKDIACLVLDSKGNQNINRKILRLGPFKNVFYSRELHKKDVVRHMKFQGIDLIMLAWWHYIIKKPLFEIPRLGFLNMHPSFLPYNRGKHYYFWNIVEEAPFGVTLHFIDETIDGGDVAFQKKISVGWQDTGFSLRQRAKKEIVKLFKENFDRIVSGNIPRRRQDLKKGTFHFGKDIESASRIDLESRHNVRQLINALRARSGFSHGGVYFYDKNKKYEINIKIKRVTDG